MLPKYVKPILLAIFPVIVACIPAGCASSDVPDERDSPDLSEPFSIVVLPDTQYYSLSHPDIFIAQTKWIVENREELNVAFVLHEGDIVHNNTDAEWKNADKAISVMDDVVPYALAIGNHDINSARNNTRFNNYFPVKRYEKQPWYGGHYEQKIDNAYYHFTAGGMKFLVVVIEWIPRDKVLAWAGKVIDKHPDHRTIILTHSYMGKDDKLFWNTELKDGNSPQQMWDKFVSKHANIFLTISGHVLSVGQRTSVGSKGNPIHQILTNYQTYPNGGNGWLRIFKFVPMENKIYVTTYSPTLKENLTAAEHEFVLEYEMTSLPR